MSVTIHADAPPIRVDEDGSWRVGTTRVLVVLVVSAYLRGATAEEIVEMYSSLSLADAHAVVAYYLRHREDVETYMAEYYAAGEEMRRKSEALFGTASETRERLLRRRDRAKGSE